MIIVSLENYNSTFTKTEENISFSVYVPGYLSEGAGDIKNLGTLLKQSTAESTYYQ